MATRFLIATGNWNATAIWSTSSGGAGGASYPVLGDTVNLNAASGTRTLTVNVSAACGTMNVTGACTCTLTLNATLLVRTTLNITVV